MEGPCLVEVDMPIRTLTGRVPPRHEIVTHVLGTKCYLCLRVGQERFGGVEGIRTLDLRSAIAALSQLSYDPIS